MTATIEETVVEVDIDAEPACDMDDCETPAAWVVRWDPPPDHFCCPPFQLLCDHHRERLVHVMSVGAGGILGCDKHRQMYFTLRTMIRAIEAL